MLIDYVRVLRPQQWYKNTLVFLALIFSGNLFSLPLVWQTIIAFATFCALSSSVYIINDLSDKTKDKLHPEKKLRPIASGAVNTTTAVILSIILLALGIYLSLFLPTIFTYSALAYFGLSQLYTFFLKKEAFLDILTIATNFVIRAAAGAYAISVIVSPWLILGVFFLAIYLVLGKRKADLALLKTKAGSHRETLAKYTPELTTQFSIIATTCLVITYTLYVFFGTHNALYLTLPISLYALFRYETIIQTGSKTARHPELTFLDPRMIASIAIWAILVILIIY